MYNIKDVEIINPDNLSEEFIASEIKDLEEAHNRSVKKIKFHDQGDDTCKEIVEWCPVGFQRIRRITGYLVGDLSRFNDAKRAEVDDRVKHTTSNDVESSENMKTIKITKTIQTDPYHKIIGVPIKDNFGDSYNVTYYEKIGERWIPLCGPERWSKEDFETEYGIYEI